MNKALLVLLLATSLGGCVVYPGRYYGRAYIAPAPVVVVASRPHYWRY